MEGLETKDKSKNEDGMSRYPRQNIYSSYVSRSEPLEAKQQHKHEKTRTKIIHEYIRVMMCAQGMYFRDKCVFQFKMFTVCSATDNHSRLFKMSIPFPLTFFLSLRFSLPFSFLPLLFLSIKVRRGSPHWTNVALIFPFFFYSLFSVNASQIYASPSGRFFLQGGYHFFLSFTPTSLDQARPLA